MTTLTCFCTCPDRDSALAIGHALVEARIAACVQLLPGLESIYRWQGRIETAREVLLLIKTRQDRLDDVVQTVRSLHPHDVPEVVALEHAGGLPAYLDWIHAQVNEIPAP